MTGGAQAPAASGLETRHVLRGLTNGALSQLESPFVAEVRPTYVHYFIPLHGHAGNGGAIERDIPHGNLESRDPVHRHAIITALYLHEKMNWYKASASGCQL